MIDAHIHLGKDYVFDGRDVTEEEILEKIDSLNLDGCVVYPANSNISLEVERENNNRVLEFAKKYPSKVYPVCQLNPNYEYEQYYDEVSKYKELGCKGISVNIEIFGWDAHSHHGKTVFDVASKLELPLFITTGIGLPLGQPIRMYELCKDYTDVKVVLVHATKSYTGDQCKTLADECPNVYLETSIGPNMRSLKGLVNRYGSKRIIMGSALPELMEHSIYSFEYSGLSEEDIENATKNTILEVLNVKGDK